MATTSTINFLDDTYARMKKSADRIAAVLGIDRPKLDNDIRSERMDASRGRSPAMTNDSHVRSGQNEKRDYQPLRQSSPPRPSERVSEQQPDLTGTKFASVSIPLVHDKV